jgi:hypothetical protein
MPWYAYAVREQRNKGIKFIKSNAGVVNVKQEKKVNYYQLAVEAEQRKSQLFEQLQQAKNEAHIARRKCIDEKFCK